MRNEHNGEGQSARENWTRAMIGIGSGEGHDGPGQCAPGSPRHRREVRRAFADRFAGIPDVRYTDDDHFADGERGASEWTLTGTTVAGVRRELRGCDLWTFRGGRVVKKDSYWKIRTDGG
jgi:SnoaL-like polyketide cyclase.